MFELHLFGLFQQKTILRGQKPALYVRRLHMGSSGDKPCTNAAKVEILGPASYVGLSLLLVLILAVRVFTGSLFNLHRSQHILVLIRLRTHDPTGLY